MLRQAMSMQSRGEMMLNLYFAKLSENNLKEVAFWTSIAHGSSSRNRLYGFEKKLRDGKKLTRLYQ